VRSSRRSRRLHGELVVQQSFPKPRATTNPYLVLLAESLAREPGVTVRTFSWRAALFGSYDVFHVHWPDILVTGGSGVKTLGRQALTALWLLRLRMTGVALVRTVHNPAPHAGVTRLQRWLLDRIDAQTALFVSLNAETPQRPGRASEVILHGHYRDWFARVAAAEVEAGAERPAVADESVGAASVASDEPAGAVPGRVAYVGLIRPYKGVVELVDVFRSVGRTSGLVTATGSGGGEGLPNVSLQIAGSPRTPELAAQLARLAELDARVTLDLRYVSDAELMRVVGDAELVVLPYQELHNSGSVLAALSLDRPVLVPANAVTDALNEEVGPGWVYRYDGTLTPTALTEALRLAHDRQLASARREYTPVVSVASVAHAAERARPDLSRREWADAGARHVAAYRRAIALRGGR
jgi:beta-1,4-mannosyltransferase